MVVLIALASIVWTPIGVWIGLRPKVAERVQPVAQFLAAFPVNLLYGAVVERRHHVPPQPQHLPQSD